MSRGMEIHHSVLLARFLRGWATEPQAGLKRNHQRVLLRDDVIELQKPCLKKQRVYARKIETR